MLLPTVSLKARSMIFNLSLLACLLFQTVLSLSPVDKDFPPLIFFSYPGLAASATLSDSLSQLKQTVVRSTSFTPAPRSAVMRALSLHSPLPACFLCLRVKYVWQREMCMCLRVCISIFQWVCRQGRSPDTVITSEPIMHLPSSKFSPIQGVNSAPLSCPHPLPIHAHTQAHNACLNVCTLCVCVCVCVCVVMCLVYMTEGVLSGDSSTLRMIECERQDSSCSLSDKD